MWLEARDRFAQPTGGNQIKNSPEDELFRLEVRLTQALRDIGVVLDDDVLVDACIPQRAHKAHEKCLGAARIRPRHRLKYAQAPRH